MQCSNMVQYGVVVAREPYITASISFEDGRQWRVNAGCSDLIQTIDS